MTKGSPLTVIELPGKPLAKFDIGWMDGDGHRFYLADRSNARVAVVDTEATIYVGALGEGLFTGATETGATSGPNGVVVLPDLGQAWAGDGNSTVKVFDTVSAEVLAIVNTYGTKRVDELAYDSLDCLVLAANDQGNPPFVSLISTAEDHEIVGKIEFPQATKGLHQPVWDADARVFYVPVSQVGDDPADGEIAVIDPAKVSVVASYAVRECQPAGLTVGPDRRLCIGCSKNAILAGFAPKSLIMDMRTGSVLTSIPQIGGSDEVWYNAGNHCYYLAAHGMVGGAVLGIIDAATNEWVCNIPTGPDSHSVAVDPRTNRAFVALAPTPALPRGGIGVYEVE